MWILPSQLSKCVQDTEGSVSVSDESLAKSCEQSLIVKSKLPRASYFLREWKKGNLMRLRSGLILSHSLGATSTGWYRSWLLDTLVSHSQPLGTEKEKMTLDTFSHTYEKESDKCVQPSACLKTSKDTSPSDLNKSSQTWKSLVTKVRSAYALRQKWGYRTNVKESSSFPTIRASEWKDTGRVGSKSHTHMLGKRYLCAVVKDLAHHQQDLTSPSIGGNLPASWATPNTMDHMDQRSPEALLKQATTARKGRKFPANLREQVNPLALKIYQSTSSGKSNINLDLMKQEYHPDQKLNPRFVEVMMGLPIGWVMSTCAKPITPEIQS